MNVEFRPTLIVGLGGTGTTVLTHVKALLLDNFNEDVFNIIRLISFDTDDRLPEVRRKNGQVARLSTDEGEFINIGYVPTTNVMRNLDRYPEIKDWLPADMPIPAITQGARMVRLLGRLSLFYHFRKIADAIDPQIRRLRHLLLPGQTIGDSASGQGAGRVTATPGMNVFLVSSVCGGTGAGTFIDMAYLIRHFCGRIISPEFVFINGVLTLPTAFPTVRAQARIKANAKACLDDLDDLMKLGFEEKYPDGHRVIFPRHAPFNVCYLVDAVNSAGYALSGLDELAPMLASSIFLQTASQVGPATKSRWDNIESVTRIFDGRITGYSGLACAKLVFPSEQMVTACSEQFCQTFIRELLPQTEQTHNAEPVVRDFVNQNRLSREALLSEILRGQGKQQRITVSISNQALEGVEIDQMTSGVQRVVQRAEQRLSEQYAAQMQANLDEVESAITKALAGKINELLNDPAHGLVAANGFVKQLELHLAELSETLTEARVQIEEKLNSDTQHCSDAFRALNQAVGSRIPILRGREVSRTSNEYIRCQDQRLRNLLSLRQHEHVLQLIAKLSDGIAQQRRTLTTLHERLANIAHELAVGADDRFDMDKALENLSQSIVTSQEAQDYYQRLLPARSQWINLAIDHCGPISTWQQWTHQALKDRLLQFARQPFRQLQEINVEQFMEQQKQGNDEIIGHWLTMIRSRSVPFWNWLKGQGSLRDDPEEIRVLGVPHQERSVFLDAPQRGEELISTNDPQVISMLSTEHGLPSSALKAYVEYEYEYESYLNNADRNLVPLRLFDGAKRGKSVEEASKVMQALAFGLLFGHVSESKDGTFYLSTPPQYDGEPWQPKHRLSRDIEHVSERLGEYPEFVSEILSYAAKFKSQKGLEGAKTKVEQFNRQFNHFPDDLIDLKLKLDNVLNTWADR